jgi:2,5-diamino-6-(ribosylamino)-4(3H)-pyrimidinone 5'-phosphate reductase
VGYPDESPPILVGGKRTATLIDGESITRTNELESLGVLSLELCEVLENSYIRLRYKVIS